MSQPAPVKIVVYGKVYTIKSSEDEKTTQELAAYIDQVMKDVGRKTGSVDVNRVAILTLLQITHELFTLRRQMEQDDSEYQRRTEKLLSKIDSAMTKGGIQTNIDDRDEENDQPDLSQI